MISFMKEFPYFIRDSSLLIIVDNDKQDAIIRMIDVNSITEFKDKSKRDEGFIFGLTNLLKYLK